MKMWTRDEETFNRARSRIQELIVLNAHDDFALPCQPLRTWAAFDFGRISSGRFLEVLKCVAQGEEKLSLLVLKPDPKLYFQAHFGAFPLIEQVQDLTPERYLSCLHEAPPSSPADSIATNGDVLAIFPDSSDWIVFGHRATELALLYMGQDCGPQQLMSCFPSEWLYARDDVRQELNAANFKAIDQVMNSFE